MVFAHRMSSKANSISKMTNYQWVIGVLLFYIPQPLFFFDRVILGILAPYITNEIGWSEQEYGYQFPFVIAAFDYLAGLLVIHLISPKMKPVSIKSE